MLINIEDLTNDYRDMVGRASQLDLFLEDLKAATNDTERKALIDIIEAVSQDSLDAMKKNTTYSSIAVTWLYGDDLVGWQMAKKPSHEFEQNVINKLHNVGLVGSATNTNAKMIFIKMAYTLGLWKEILRHKDIIKAKIGG